MTAASAPSYLTVQLRVIKALILRDIRTRFFGNGLGYILAMLWPFVHMGVLLIAYIVTGRVAPIGDNLVLFLAAAVVPVICYLYMSRFIMFSVQANMPLLYFPIMKFMDIIVARTLLEAAGACCVAALMAAVLFSLDVPVYPSNPSQAAEAFLATLLFGVGSGALNGVIVIKLPGWTVVYILISVVFYGTSGILFLPDSLPTEVRDIVAWNPLVHSVEWMREAYFADYRSSVLSKEYLLGLGGALIFLSLLVERVFRRMLRR